MEKRIWKLSILGLVFVILLYWIVFMALIGPPSDVSEAKIAEKGVVSYAPENCIDSDYGNYPADKGIVTLMDKNEEIKFEDRCYNSSTIFEYSCPGSDLGYNAYVCKDSCSDGACNLGNDFHLLDLQIYPKDSINYVNVSEDNGKEHNLVCGDLIEGQACDFGGFNLVVEKINYINQDQRSADLSFGVGGQPFGDLFDKDGNLISLPIKNDFPSNFIPIKIIDKNGFNFIQEFNFTWIDGNVVMVNGDLSQGKNHGFIPYIYDNVVYVNVTRENAILSIPVLYGDGAQFLGMGGNNTYVFPTSRDNFLTYDFAENHGLFVLSSTSGGVDQNVGELCSAVYTSNVSECLEGDKNELYYYTTDTFSNDFCGADVPVNKTYTRCDYDDNGIIGEREDVDVDFDLTIYEDGRLFNNSQVFDDFNYFDFDEGSESRVKFDFNFSKEKLDFTNIYLRKQDSNDNRGYLIVNGLEDVKKTFYIDKISNSTDSVCVKKAEIDGIGAISGSCGRSDEEVVKCDGGDYSNFTCTGQGGDYKVTGLINSAVLEFDSILPVINNTSCSPIWTCTSWSVCSSDVRSRICADSNGCGVETNKPEESEICASTKKETSSCSELGGEVCGENLICDIGITTASDGDCCLSVCESDKDTGTYFWVIFSILILAIIAVVVMIILSLKHKSYGKATKFEISK